MTRLSALAQLSSDEIDALAQVHRTALSVRARKEIIGAEEPVKKPRLLLTGWAARVCNFADGRRQILHILLPGDLIDVWQPEPLALTAVTSLTQVQIAPAPTPMSPDGGLALAYARCTLIEQRYLYRQIARLGRCDAAQRLADLFLELGERLTLTGLGDMRSFPLPMTQELLADTLGVTTVHLNRTLQLMRRDELVEMRAGMVYLLDRERLERMVE